MRKILIRPVVCEEGVAIDTKQHATEDDLAQPDIEVRWVILLPTPEGELYFADFTTTEDAEECAALIAQWAAPCGTLVENPLPSPDLRKEL